VVRDLEDGPLTLTPTLGPMRQLPSDVARQRARLDADVVRPAGLAITRSEAEILKWRPSA